MKHTGFEASRWVVLKHPGERFRSCPAQDVVRDWGHGGEDGATESSWEERWVRKDACSGKMTLETCIFLSLDPSFPFLASGDFDRPLGGFSTECKLASKGFLIPVIFEIGIFGGGELRESGIRESHFEAYRV